MLIECQQVVSINKDIIIHQPHLELLLVHENIDICSALTSENVLSLKCVENVLRLIVLKQYMETNSDKRQGTDSDFDVPGVTK